jgi:hypothetical protein
MDAGPTRSMIRSEKQFFYTARIGTRWQFMSVLELVLKLAPTLKSTFAS